MERLHCYPLNKQDNNVNGRKDRRPLEDLLGGKGQTNTYSYKSFIHI